MKYLVLTDIHGNSEALEAVLEDVADEAVETILVLGDLVGYGAGPNEVIERIRGFEQPTVVIRGNHDKVVVTPHRDAHFNAVARLAVRWTAEHLSSENLEYLRDLPSGPIEVEAGLFVCHGSPTDEDEYLINLEDAAFSLDAHPGLLTFFGHTHIPTCFTKQEGRFSSLVLEGDGLVIDIEPDTRYLANPGSVGQPRDRDPRAAYFVYDSTRGQIAWRRCDYAIEEAQRRILEAGLPPVLAHRLSVGI